MTVDLSTVVTVCAECRRPAVERYRRNPFVFGAPLVRGLECPDGHDAGLIAVRYVPAEERAA